eukprot:3318354-Lingulodinium_polyedra.AAC.1
MMLLASAWSGMWQPVGPCPARGSGASFGRLVSRTQRLSRFGPLQPRLAHGFVVAKSGASLGGGSCGWIVP